MPGLSNFRIWTVCVFAATIFCVPTRATVTRNDVVIMKNGDRLSGNVKKLEHGVLYIETVYLPSSVGVDWKQVESIQSTATFQIVLIGGERLVGKIEKLPKPDAQNENFVIRDDRGETRILDTKVADIDQQKPTFWRQLTGSINFGYSFTSGNSQSSATLSANATYATQKWSNSAAVSTAFNGQSGASKTNNIDTQFTTQRYLNRDSSIFGLSDFLHSSQQDLELRTALGGGYGRYWIRTTATNFGWLAGAVYTNERFNPVGSVGTSDNNVEGLLGAKYDYYRFNVGEIQSQLLLFPGLSDSGRIRITTNNSLTISLTNNFHFTFTFWDNFDSRPPNFTKKNELGISSGVGWSF